MLVDVPSNTGYAYLQSQSHFRLKNLLIHLRILTCPCGNPIRKIPARFDLRRFSTIGFDRRWDTFQSRLRERRKEAVSGCSTCSGKSAVKRGSESVDRLRKAV